MGMQGIQGFQGFDFFGGNLKNVPKMKKMLSNENEIKLFDDKTIEDLNILFAQQLGMNPLRYQDADERDDMSIVEDAMIVKGELPPKNESKEVPGVGGHAIRDSFNNDFFKL